MSGFSDCQRRPLNVFNMQETTAVLKSQPANTRLRKSKSENKKGLEAKSVKADRRKNYSVHNFPAMLTRHSKFILKNSNFRSKNNIFLGFQLIETQLWNCLER